ncbi:MAG: leucine-rich repeat domain-containing protein, partial [Simkaniaceae bacterium]|nr:leucine-rich repeat domain-containing protein [Simkaniaceae bacterium]
IPASLSSLTELNYLALNHNQLTSIPETFSSLTHLGVLYLGQNQLTTIPDSLSSLTGLWWLDLSHNQLTKIPEAFSSLTHLKQLELSQNPLLSIPKFVLDQNMLKQSKCHCPLTSALKAYSRLPDGHKEYVHYWNWHLAGEPISPEDPNWGKTHLLDDLERFQTALKTHLSQIIDQLPAEVQCHIYTKIYEYGKPVDQDAFDLYWGYNHRFDNLEQVTSLILTFL